MAINTNSYGWLWPSFMLSKEPFVNSLWIIADILAFVNYFFKEK